MKQKSSLFLAALCLLISIQARPAQNSETKMPFDSEKPNLEPKVFAPDKISTGDYEICPEFSADGTTLYFVKSSPDANFWTIVFSRLENDQWSNPQIAPFSGQYSDADEFITADGNEMFFISSRPLPSSADAAPRKFDIWVMDKTPQGWSEPRNLGAPVNSEDSEYFPILSNDGTLYFGSRRPGGNGGADLYRSRVVKGEYTAPENLGDTINTTFDEFEPLIAPDESFLIFMAGGRPDGLGGFDLYISYNRNGQWTQAQNLGAPINSSADELSPRVSPDGKYFFWASTRTDFSLTLDRPLTTLDLFEKLRSPRNGLGDIYYIDVSALKIERR